MHSLALLGDGTLYSWGVNDEGALGRQTDGAVWEDAQVSSCANALPRVMLMPSVIVMYTTMVYIMLDLGPVRGD